jgi:hypothetical protein
MPPTKFKMDSGWKKWEHAIDPAVMKAKLRRNLFRATTKNGLIAVATIRNTIKAAGFEENKPLTVMIKSSSKPLVDHGASLFQAITHRVVDDTTVFAGIIQTSGEYNIALALHEGAIINVTDEMRGMFFYLWQVSSGALPPDRLQGRARELWERAPGGWYPLQPGTSSILIPSRPFIQQAFADRGMRMKARENWQNAIKQTMRELASGK